MMDDMYSLLEHLRSEELKAHNEAVNCKTFEMEQVHKAREKFARELINMIENSPSQRPHIQVGGEYIP
jgi:hypothetical protein